MGRLVAIRAAELDETPRQQVEVLGFFETHLHPVVEKWTWHRLMREPPDQVPSHVNGIQFDVG